MTDLFEPSRRCTYCDKRKPDREFPPMDLVYVLAPVCWDCIERKEHL